MKVLFILGSSRCGSTILSNILGELDGFFSGGEIRFLWTRVLEGRRCGCQRPVSECDLWTSVLSAEGLARKNASMLKASQHEALRLHHAPGLVRRSRERLLHRPPLARYVHAMTDVYERLSSITGADVIVDSSKRPSNAAVLRLMPGVDPYFLHLVRDSRGVAYSRRRPKPNPDGAGEMPIDSLQFSAVDWMATNLAAEDVMHHSPRGRSMFLRYEDFVADPKGTIELIVAFLGEDMNNDPFIDAHTVVLGANHTVSGNADRFRTGPLSLRPDMEWVHRMRRWDRDMTTAMTFPLLLRYRYPAHPTAGRISTRRGEPKRRAFVDRDDKQSTGD